MSDWTPSGWLWLVTLAALALLIALAAHGVVW